jgi:Cupin domain.
MKVINKDLLQDVCKKALESPRLRMNYNLHDSLEAKAQKLLNALQKGTILPVHRHTHTSETYIILQGKIKVMIYSGDRDAKGNLIEKQSVILSPDSNLGIEIAANEWHTLEVMEDNSVIFEVKEGPYTPLSADDILEN